jgi:murein DD-endopeptidase MepM/ murein hydrolase activator NlpD
MKIPFGNPIRLFLLVAIPVLLLVSMFMLFSADEPAPEAIIEMVEEPPALDEFGFELNAFLVDTGVVAPRQTLSHILARFEMGPAEVDAIAGHMQEVFSPRRIRAGQSYYGYYEATAPSSLRYFVYEISPLEYLKIDFSDSLGVFREQKEVQTKVRTATGIITSSLWNVLKDHNLHPELAIRMSEVLAWEVDFYRIQQGDRFKVVYREDFTGVNSVGVAGIDAVYFVHQGRDILGFHFEQDTVSGFFNPQGESLRKVFLKMPLEFGRISSRYSQSRMHPILNQRRPHYGTDYAAPHGTPILAVGDGVVTQTSYTSGNGNYVRIRHNSVYDTQYLHMSRFASGIRPGVRVTQGQVIGYVGSTGLATGPHVCFRFWKNGQQVDHLREEFPSADPLPEIYMEAFRVKKDSLMRILDAMAFREGPTV